VTPLAWVVLVIALGGLAVLLRRATRKALREIHIAQAREAFALERERLPEVFRKAAAATGRPRGLRWLACDFDAHWLLVRDRAADRLVALVPVTVQFEADPEGDLADNPNADLPRSGTAVFTFQRGGWITAGRVYFNLVPADALARMRDRLDPIEE
jgi:hypothetical protein